MWELILGQAQLTKSLSNLGQSPFAKGAEYLVNATVSDLLPFLPPLLVVSPPRFLLGIQIQTRVSEQLMYQIIFSPTMV